MKIRKLGVMTLALGLSTAMAYAEWGKGLGYEHKTIFVPIDQQSGWRVESEPAAEAASTPATVRRAPADVEKPSDSDRDGVIDERDNCEGTPAGTKVDAAGCPLEAKAIPETDWTLEGIQFETGSDKIKSGSQASLDEAAEMLRTHTRVVVEVQGHTDDIGSDAANQSLSEKRAAAVRNYLVEKGVSAGRLQAKGYGEAKPVADNTTPEGRAKNRRIDFKVLSR